MAVRTAYDPTAGEVLTATNLEKLAGGWIGYAQITADQTGISTEVDITSLSVAVTVGPTRYIRITGFIRCLPSATVADFTGVLKIAEGGTTLAQASVAAPNNANAYAIFASVVLASPSTGAHTYKLTASRNAGSGTMTVDADATAPCYILVEDLGST